MTDNPNGTSTSITPFLSTMLLLASRNALSSMRLVGNYNRLSTMCAVSTSTVNGYSSSSSSGNNNPLVLAAFLATASFLGLTNTVSDCCGIAGVVGTIPTPKSNQLKLDSPHSVLPHNNAREFLLEGLTVLKNRGYDSAGVATVGPVTNEATGETATNLLITKFASAGDRADGVELVKLGASKNEQENVPFGAVHVTGIAHTRWATH